MLPTRDEKLYRQMAVPFTTREEASQACEAFLEELYKLRKKHRIANVHVVTRVIAQEDDEPFALMGAVHIGDALLGEPMAAYGFGVATEGREKAIQSALASGSSTGRKKE